jgi:hypothetical protein
MASLHWAAIWFALSWARDESSSSFCGLYTTAKRTLPARSQFTPTVSYIFSSMSARNGMLRKSDTP